MSSSKYNVGNVIQDAQAIENAWAANPEFVLGTTTLDDFRKEIALMAGLYKNTRAKRQELRALAAERDAQCARLNDLVVRARSGLIGAFGRASIQVMQLGSRARRRSSSAPDTAPAPLTPVAASPATVAETPAGATEKAA
jgi:hypothetical protein